MTELSRFTRWERDQRASGKVRVTAWLHPEEATALERVRKNLGIRATRTDAIVASIRAADSA